MKINKDLYSLLSTLLVNVEPIILKSRMEDDKIKLNIINSLLKIKELKEILEQQDYNSSKKFKQSSFFK